MTPEAATAAVKARAKGLGFHLAGVASAGPLDEDWERYRAFIAAGLHGSMGWLAANADARRDVDGPAVLDGARSVVVCALAYHRGDEPSPVEGAAVARYARGRDYHNFVRRRLRRLAAWMRESLGAQARPMVDTAPVLERAWARRAGVGFVGKNGLVIAPGLGSWLLLGEVVTDLALAPDAPMEERCGACTRCLDACPTSAFVAPWVLDARRCVSYLTIEHEGEVDPTLREAMGDRLFGCDDCQAVCPYNRTAPPSLESTRDFAPDPRWEGVSVSDLLEMDEARYKALTEGTPLARPGRAGLARNAANVLGNVGRRVHLPVLSRAAEGDPDAAVRATASWASRRVRSREPR
ncbi:MAG: tRNA epoxyqueuosine(34) reductase QueG [Polyangiales bacterium]